MGTKSVRDESLFEEAEEYALDDSWSVAAKVANGNAGLAADRSQSSRRLIEEYQERKRLRAQLEDVFGEMDEF